MTRVVGSMRASSRTIPAVILAGGQGSRLGMVDKCLLPINGTPLLSRIKQRLTRQTDHIYLNANGDATRFNAFGLPVVPDQLSPPVGPLGGILSMLKLARERHPHTGFCLSVAGDSPFIPDDLLVSLLKAIPPGNDAVQRPTVDVVYCRSRARDHFVVALWSTSLVNQLEHFLSGAQRSVGSFIRSTRFTSVDFIAEPFDPFFNINTEQQWQQASAIAQHNDIQ